MAEEPGAFVLDVGRRRQLANRVQAGYGFATGGFLCPVGAVAVAGVGHLPRSVGAIFIVAGLLGVAAGRSMLRRNRGIAAEDRLVIDQHGVRIEGKNGWAYDWGDITRVRAYYAPAPGQTDQMVTLFGSGPSHHPSPTGSELITFDLGWNWGRVLPDIVKAVDHFGPGRYERGRRPRRVAIGGKKG